MNERIDQVNAQIAASVDPKIQLFALQAKREISTNPLTKYVSDDEAIILTDRNLKHYSEFKDALKLFAFAIFIISVTGIAHFSLGVTSLLISIFAIYFAYLFAESYAKSKLDEKIKNDILVTGATKKQRENDNIKPSFSNNSPFDVPPQND